VKIDHQAKAMRLNLRGSPSESCARRRVTKKI
jgi:hypothetical protein